MTTYTAVLVTPGSRVYMPKFNSIDGALQRMRRKDSPLQGEPFCPVAIWPVDEDKFCRAAGLLKLPASKSIEWAAVRFATMPIVQEWQEEWRKHLHASTPEVTVPLFADWERAVNAKEVASA